MPLLKIGLIPPTSAAISAYFFFVAGSFFTRQPWDWVKKIAVLTGIMLLTLTIVSFMNGIPSTGGIVAALAYFHFAKTGSKKAIHSGKEFSKSSIKNYILLILAIFLIIGGIVAWFNYMLLK